MFQLSVAALLFATLFSGAALYISLVEHPARLELTDGPLLMQWQPSYKRALPIQSGLAIAGGAAGILAGYLSADWRWFAGSALLLANWPFTLTVIMPVNKRLMAMPEREASAASRAMLIQWGKLHNIRSLLGAATTLLFAWALVGAG
ncbi:DUF1772 domain-containing protein [Novosphingobium sp. CECT 9465]|uniref:DUF1772 domain-containing protein n=1 Tax=Novosphingobium sp. CECT 9465 TaxID=2829794 RepID=UPI001E35946A|nr:DUF1772 domain-containing protein [Novosphingobium sp. CECT 9465]CAH0495931.1 hypothetical protein NVSP9465_00953 [Novosphingobium sp. CECT 9465]